MKHDFIDRYSRLESPVHSVEPRAKILALFALIVICVTTPPEAWWSFLVYAGLMVIIAAGSRLPLRYFFSRLLIVVPFILVVAVFIAFLHHGGGSYDLGLFSVSRGGLLVLFNITAKSLISVACLLLLSSTTPFPQLMRGFQRLHVPRFFTDVASFMYRYIYVIVDEAMRLKRARDSRRSRAVWIWQAGAGVHMMAVLLSRSYNRAERTYNSMCSRGFDGEFPRWKDRSMRASDYFFMVMVTATALAGRLVVLWA